MEMLSNEAIPKGGHLDSDHASAKRQKAKDEREPPDRRNGKYRQLILAAIAALCRKGPSPADDKFIHTALAAKAPWLVTGDQNLLVLPADIVPLGVRIVSPAEALAAPEFNTGH